MSNTQTRATNMKVQQCASSIKKRNQVYIGSLPSFTKKSNILDYFKSLSIPVSSIKVFTDKNHNLCKGYAFVTLPEEFDTSAFLAQEHFILNRKVVCDVYTSGQRLEEKKRSIETRRVFVSNIPQKMGNIELKRIFSRFGEVVTAYRIRKFGSGKLMPYGYLFFKEENNAKTCVEDGGVFVSEEHGWVFAESYSKDRGEKEKRRVQRKRALEQRKRKGSEEDKLDLSSMNRIGGQFVDLGTQGNEAIEDSEKQLGYEIQDYRKLKNNSTKFGYQPLHSAPFSRNQQFKQAPVRQETSSCKHSNRSNEAQEEKTDSFGSIGSPKLAHVIEIENKRKMRKRKKLNRRIKKQLKFDNFLPCESEYWTASMKRQAYFLKFREQNFRINRPARNNFNNMNMLSA